MSMETYECAATRIRCNFVQRLPAAGEAVGRLVEVESLSPDVMAGATAGHTDNVVRASWKALFAR